jgi:hypothetical protein
MSAFRLTQIFALICVHTPPGNRMALFRGNYKAMTDDSLLLDMLKHDLQQLLLAERKVICLFRLEKILNDLGSTLQECNMKIRRSQQRAMSSILLEQEGFEPEALVNQRLGESFEMFNHKQGEFFDIIRNALKQPDGGRMFYYLNGPGGTGKMFLLSSILDLATVKHIDL